MTRRTLPGTVPGLIRRCSPVLIGDAYSRRGVVVGDAPFGVRVWTPEGSVMREAATLLLDCDDPTGQDHAMRWIAERMGMAVLSEEIEAGGDVDALIRTVQRLTGAQS